jgi:hypothetical protein
LFAFLRRPLLGTYLYIQYGGRDEHGWPPRHAILELVACRCTCSCTNDRQATPLVYMEVNRAGKPHAAPSAVPRLTSFTLQAPAQLQLRLCKGAAVRHAFELHPDVLQEHIRGCVGNPGNTRQGALPSGADSKMNKFKTVSMERRPATQAPCDARVIARLATPYAGLRTAFAPGCTSSAAHACDMERRCASLRHDVQRTKRPSA